MKNGLKVDVFGNKKHFLNDQLHREDGPAAEYIDGVYIWYQYGKKHRLDGPAVFYKNEVDLDVIFEWHYQGQRIYCNSQEEFERIIKLKLFW